MAEATAMEDNVSLRCAERGRRETLRSVDAPLPCRRWPALRVEFRGTGIKVMLDGKARIEVDDFSSGPLPGS